MHKVKEYMGSIVEILSNNDLNGKEFKKEIEKKVNDIAEIQWPKGEKAKCDLALNIIDNKLKEVINSNNQEKRTKLITLITDRFLNESDNELKFNFQLDKVDTKEIFNLIANGFKGLAIEYVKNHIPEDYRKAWFMAVDFIDNTYSGKKKLIIKFIQESKKIEENKPQKNETVLNLVLLILILNEKYSLIEPIKKLMNEYGNKEEDSTFGFRLACLALSNDGMDNVYPFFEVLFPDKEIRYPMCCFTIHKLCALKHYALAVEWIVIFSKKFNIKPDNVFAQFVFQSIVKKKFDTPYSLYVCYIDKRYDHVIDIKQDLVKKLNETIIVHLIMNGLEKESLMKWLELICNNQKEAIKNLIVEIKKDNKEEKVSNVLSKLLEE